VKNCAEIVTQAERFFTIRTNAKKMSEGSDPGMPKTGGGFKNFENIKAVRCHESWNAQDGRFSFLFFSFYKKNKYNLGLIKNKQYYFCE